MPNDNFRRREGGETAGEPGQGPSVGKGRPCCVVWGERERRQRPAEKWAGNGEGSAIGINGEAQRRGHRTWGGEELEWRHMGGRGSQEFVFKTRGEGVPPPT